LHPLQWIGIALIATGVFLLTVKKRVPRGGGREGRVSA
jgi:drug/metabolite transporter (DMT)-like permease